ncbi:hypothetical protein BH24DEI1_BH24DEI1_14940 [soil metagenome]
MAALIQIGNSKGVRIPKALIEQAGLGNSELELKVVRGGLLIRPVKQPRQGWGEAIKAAVERGEVTYDQEWLGADLDGDLDTLPNS